MKKKKLIDRVMEELLNLGLQPKRTDFGIMFNYQMATYIYLEDKGDEDYFALYIPHIFDVDSENRADVFVAANAVNHDFKVVKITVNDDGNVWACFEESLPKDADIGEDLVHLAVVMLSQARQRFYDKLKEA